MKEIRIVKAMPEDAEGIIAYTKKIGGLADFSSVEHPRIGHRGSMGISVRKDMWGKGVGSMLMEHIIDFAKNVAKVDIIALEVRSDNERAIHLYEKYGFEKFGTFKGYMKIRGEFVDFDFMNLYL